ncbi:homogentisate 1,2-dioxygenase domain-containing protein [Nocardioides convexus]|uniref:homogentisate 1,2-dioxygenase n=1 Tax=Nocardioides convexus TaxID=2712224 RepID=UPI002418612C|nr:homogentisate 1,2-dioxygenase domain-containing protein [Nocardioides convexus]
MLGNGDVRISYVVCGKASPLYRNGIGDECVYVEAGTAIVETVFGALEVGEGDYVVLPRATTHRWVPTGREPLRLYAIEANSHITPPKRYLSRFGRLLEHAPYCERDLRTPAEPLLVGTDGPVEVYIKHRGPGAGGLAGTVHVVPEHPFDVVGWDGCLYPYVLNIADFEPITGRVHQPPPVHQVFEGHGFVICNFVPRKVDYHPLSIPVPYYHSNVDSDEVMFYVGGDYEARKGSGIGPGSISLHPGGHAHGPQPGAYERSIGVEFFDESRRHGRHLPAAGARRGRAGRGRRGLRDLVGAGAGMSLDRFERLLDDAAIFPPGDLPLAEAVRAHLAHGVAPHAALVGPLVVSLADLPVLAEATAGLPVGSIALSITVPSPAAAGDVLDRVRRIRAARPVAVEVAVPADLGAEDVVPALTVALGEPRGTTVYVEPAARRARQGPAGGGSRRRRTSPRSARGACAPSLYPDEAEPGRDRGGRGARRGGVQGHRRAAPRGPQHRPGDRLRAARLPQPARRDGRRARGRRRPRGRRLARRA